MCGVVVPKERLRAANLVTVAPACGLAGLIEGGGKLRKALVDRARPHGQVRAAILARIFRIDRPDGALEYAALGVIAADQSVIANEEWAGVVVVRKNLQPAGGRDPSLRTKGVARVTNADDRAERVDGRGAAVGSFGQFAHRAHGAVAPHKGGGVVEPIAKHGRRAYAHDVTVIVQSIRGAGGVARQHTEISDGVERLRNGRCDDEGGVPCPAAAAW